MEVAHRGAVTHLETELLLEKSMELDSRPVKLAGLARILQNWHEEVAQAFQLHPASSPRRPLSSQRVNATNVEHLDPEPHHSIRSAKLLGHYPALQSHEQRAYDRKPDITTSIGRGLHCHPQILQRGVLRIGLCLLTAQSSFSRKSLPIVQALFRKFLMRRALDGGLHPVEKTRGFPTNFFSRTSLVPRRRGSYFT